MADVAIETTEQSGVGLRTSSESAALRTNTNTLHPLWGAIIGEITDQADLIALKEQAKQDLRDELLPLIYAGL